jgi:hypothetical protein
MVSESALQIALLFEHVCQLFDSMKARGSQAIAFQEDPIFIAARQEAAFVQVDSLREEPDPIVYRFDFGRFVDRFLEFMNIRRYDIAIETDIGMRAGQHTLAAHAFGLEQLPDCEHGLAEPVAANERIGFRPEPLNQLVSRDLARGVEGKICKKRARLTGLEPGDNLSFPASVKPAEHFNSPRLGLVRHHRELRRW